MNNSVSNLLQGLTKTDLAKRFLEEELHDFKNNRGSMPTGRESEDVVENTMTRMNPYGKVDYKTMDKLYQEVRTQYAGH